MFSAIWLLGTVRSITDQGVTDNRRKDVGIGQDARIRWVDAMLTSSRGGKFGREQNLGRNGSFGRFAQFFGGALGD